jgi:hypothetical protein
MGKLIMKKIHYVVGVLLSALAFLGIFSISKPKKITVAKQPQSQQESNVVETFNGIPLSKILTDSKVYESTEELEESADIIFIGKPITDIAESKPISKKIIGSKQNKGQFFLYNPGESYTATDDTGAIVDSVHFLTVKVQKVLKGDIKTKTIDFGEPAALVKPSNDLQYIITPEDYTPVKKNKKYVFFLLSTDALMAKHADLFRRAGYTNSMPGKYILLSARFGKYNLDLTDTDENKQVSKDSKVKEFKEKISGKYRKDYDAALDADTGL